MAEREMVASIARSLERRETRDEGRYPPRRAAGCTVTAQEATDAILAVGSDFTTMSLTERRAEIRRWAWRLLGVEGLRREDVIAAAQEVQPRGRYVTCDELRAECIRQRDTRRRREQTARDLDATKALPAGRSEAQHAAGLAAIRALRGKM